EELQRIPELVYAYNQPDMPQHAQINEPFFFYNTRRLEIFSTLYLTKGIKNTASLLNITQPAVCSAINFLEDALNTYFFIRTPNGINATAICNDI
ncbi:LysR family transcriptional regulator, partial [Acinetobacter baumannii]|nr:LysR family transcriptional regulator [Acinetobacter baumannii]